MASEMVTLPAAAIPDLRRMLAIGLACLSEVERVSDAITFSEKHAQDKVPEEYHPIHPTGAKEHGDFAGALMWLDQATPVEDRNGEA